MTIFYENHKQYPDLIFVRNFTSIISVNDIIDSWDYLLDNHLITEGTKGIINNLTACKLDMNMNSFGILTDYLKNHDNLKKIKLAVICNDPEIIIFPMLGELNEKELNIKPFSTEPAAVNWIIN